MTDEHLDESEVYHIRKQKLSELREQGFNFPNHFHRKDYAVDLNTTYGYDDKATLEEKQVKAAVAGRIVYAVLWEKPASFISRMYLAVFRYMSEKMISLIYMINLPIGISAILSR